MKVLQDERDALLATRPGSCGAFLLPDSLSELSTLVEVKTRELTNAVLSSALATIGHKINVVQNGTTEQDVKRRAVSNAPITKLLLCFEDAQVYVEHGGLRLPVARRITT